MKRFFRRTIRRAVRFEQLEPREVCANDLAFTSLRLVGDGAEFSNIDFATSPGRELAVDVAVANQGTTESDFQVELRLSVDATIDESDRLLDVVARGALDPAESDAWTESVTIPADVVRGRYYVGATLREAADNPDLPAAPNSLAAARRLAVFAESLDGVVSYGGRAAHVAIHSWGAEDAPLRDDVPTWLVIHGRNSSPDSPNLVQLEQALDAARGGDQVLVLDWSEAAASGAVGGTGENFIKPVAMWAAAALSAYGLSGAELNVVGHSWGAYVGAELAERVPAPKGQPGRVNSILAIDPAVDYPGGSYNPTARGEVSFARNSLFSWSFYAAGGGFGSATLAATAHEATLVLGSDHFKIVQVVADLTTLAAAPAAGPATLAAQYSFDRLLVTHAANGTWRANSYDARGRKVRSGTFEAVLAVNSTGELVASLRYATRTGEVLVGR